MLRLMKKAARKVLKRRTVERPPEETPLAPATPALPPMPSLFDPTWYNQHYLDVAASQQDPWQHFLLYGAHEGRNPGPLFDTQWYLFANPDVGHSGINPLLHYVDYGFVEGRPAKSNIFLEQERFSDEWIHTMTKTDAEQDISIPLHHYAPQKDAALSIAVVIHAYYADVFDLLCPLLHNIPVHFSLFIATPTQDVKEHVQQTLAKEGLNAYALVKVCPNRGRNFGPFLAEFSEQILEHDVVLHLHTKKSLYTGSEQNAWRQNLYETLLGNPYIAQTILYQFQADPSLGVVYPATFRTMPYWAHHWLSNGHLAPGLFHRLGIADYQKQGYIDYPVGGMFWARVSAIKPLFTAGFTYEDFPAEAGQTDGTLAHAIERSIVEIAKYRGYSFHELDIEHGIQYQNFSDKNLWQYTHLTPAALTERIDAADLVSFDFFDTLAVRRSSTPDALMHYTGYLLHEEQGLPADFFEVRKAAETEARARKQYQGDVSLDEIYAAFPSVSSWSPAAAARAKDAELRVDFSMLLPREAGISAVRQARQRGKRVILMTDTYYPRAFIQELLKKFAIEDCFNEIYVSSERQARKDRGDMWELVARTENVAPQRWLHIGDNEQSDVQAAVDRSIGTFHVMNPFTLASAQGFSFGNTVPWEMDLMLGPLVHTLGDNPFVERGGFHSLHLERAEDVGYRVFGPIMFAFTTWMVTHPMLRHMQHLYFLSREGYALQQFYDIFRQALPASSLPSSTYLLTSRRTVIAAAQGVAFDPREIMGTTDYDGTLATFLKSRLGLTLSADYPTDDVPVILPAEAKEVERLLKLLKDPIVLHGQQELSVYRRYLEQVGFLSQWPIGVVDIGYSGTIQSGLQKILNKGLVGFYLGTYRSNATFTRIEQVFKRSGSAFGCFLEDGDSDNFAQPLTRFPLLLEAFLTAPDGQLERLEVVGEQLKPVFKRETRSQRSLDILEELHQGAARYCRDVFAQFGAASITANIHYEPFPVLIQMLGTGRIRVSQEVAEALNVEDDFSGKGVHEMGKSFLNATTSSRDQKTASPIAAPMPDEASGVAKEALVVPVD